MPIDRPQDKWLQADANAQLKAYTEQRMKGAWFRVAWSGALLVLFALTLSRRLEFGQKNDGVAGFAGLTLLVLGRFGYYVFRVLKARKDVAAMRQTLGVIVPQ